MVSWELRGFSVNYWAFCWLRNQFNISIGSMARSQDPKQAQWCCTEAHRVMAYSSFGRVKHVRVNSCSHLTFKDAPNIYGWHSMIWVRQIEQRYVDFILTLPQSHTFLGQCRVQHLWFPTITEMLEHFQQHPIPLEQGGVADVRLTEYVINRPPVYPSPRHVR